MRAVFSPFGRGVIKDSHTRVFNKGFYEENKPITFSFDFKEWKLDPHDSDALEHLKRVESYLLVPDESKRDSLADKVSATFTQNNYLRGYFEHVTAEDLGFMFIDYSRILGELYKDYKTQPIVRAVDLGSSW